jgi:hypothetical protein
MFVDVDYVMTTLPYRLRTQKGLSTSSHVADRGEQWSAQAGIAACEVARRRSVHEAAVACSGLDGQRPMPDYFRYGLAACGYISRICSVSLPAIRGKIAESSQVPLDCKIVMAFLSKIAEGSQVR